MRESLPAGGCPPGAFKDKIVVIGAKQQAGTSNAGKDMFATPYTPVLVVDRPGREVPATYSRHGNPGDVDGKSDR